MKRLRAVVAPWLLLFGVAIVPAVALLLRR